MTIITDVLEEVASVEESDTGALPPLHGAIDPEVIVSFVDSVSADTASLEFIYCEHRVVVQGDGKVIVE